MTTIASNYPVRPAGQAAITPAGVSVAGTSAGAPSAVASAVGVSISSLASRLSRAEGARGAALSREALGDKVRANIERVNYPLDAQHKAAAARQVPEPNDAASSASAQAANEYVDNPQGPNPFAGLSREQLSTIVNDESGTFTINERRAAYRQAYDEEQKWREKVVAQAMQEYHDTGKLTGFFKSVLEHFNGLPEAEQALYPQDYASNLEGKIKLDFNYFTHTAGGQVSPASPGSAGDAGIAQWLAMPETLRDPDVPR